MLPILSEHHRLDWRIQINRLQFLQTVKKHKQK
jgi:hypothetical protein